MKNNEIIALWRKTSKASKTYFSGKDNTGVELTGFYNINKGNDKAPVLRVYKRGDINKEVLPMWLKTAKSGIKYLSGKYDGKNVVGFINDKPKKKKKTRKLLTFAFTKARNRQHRLINQNKKNLLTKEISHFDN